MINGILKTLALVFTFLVINTPLIFAQNSKIDPSVFNKMKGNKAEIFVVMKEQADLSKASLLETKEQKGDFVFQILRGVALRSQSNIQTFLKEQKVDFQSFWIFNGVFLTADKNLITQIAERNDVAQIVSNPSSSLNLPPVEAADLKDNTLKTRGALDITWGIKAIKADAVWNLGYTGQGVIVGGQDTGYDWEHPAIKKKYRGFNAATGQVDHNYNWYDAIHRPDTTLPVAQQTNPCGYNSKKPCDDNNHGTHTMGTMVGRDDTIAIGVAPDAQWISARNMDKGNGTLYSYTECFQWFLAPTDSMNKLPNPRKAPHVMNNSWYCSAGEGCNASNFAILEAALNACRAAGIVVVVSAGNAGSNCSTINEGPPAFYSKAFSIGATRSDDTIAVFSSRGPVTIDGSNRLKPNVSAPGVGVKSSIPNGRYASYNGTSMAGPHVAGAVALMISANPRLAGQVDTIERILERTTRQMTTTQNCGNVLGTSIPNNTYGFGRIDVLEAVKQALNFRYATSISNNSIEKIVKISPNPFSSEINVYTEGFEGETQVEIVNVSGQVVVSKKENFNFINNVTIELPNLASGIYFYRIQNETQRLVGKLVKM
jgi:serine protease AprX